MKILIIEDESIVARNLEKLIKRLEPNAETVAVLSSVESSKKWMQENELPDLIFSDIQLSDGVSFEIFESLHVHSPIIFTTAYNEFAIRAFKLNSIDYLLKPIDVSELEAALNKYKSYNAGGIWTEQIKNMIHHWEDRAGKQYKERFLTLHRNTMVPIAGDGIAFFHKAELVYLHTIDNEKLISDHQTLDELETLIDPKKFFRVNRQYIVHIQAVGKVKTTHKGLAIQLKGPFTDELEVSREKAAAFKKWLV